MKTASIRELHEHTGKLVRASAKGKIVITERGRPVALLKTVEAADLAGKPFPKRDLRRMPKVSVDSTDYISADRDAG
ncbi:MAG TPA: type II toxin-antitoxin system prevent-host-death family antitoxin [Chthoniobacteraceae bacterium]|nr:type II toxin-antitoxin system prevent-host-death family antitoxin [Chthoniobacteraceae bacterium]